MYKILLIYFSIKLIQLWVYKNKNKSWKIWDSNHLSQYPKKVVEPTLRFQTKS